MVRESFRYGLNFSYNTETDKAHFGLEAKGGAFLVDNVALLIDAGAKWQGGGTDVYYVGCGRTLLHQ